VRVVLDSNVLISAAISPGPSHRIVRAWLEDQPFELIVCERLLNEVENVLTQRSRLRRWITVEAAELYVARLSTAADVLPDPPAGLALTRDPADDFVIHLARQRGADVIVSGDRDLLEWPDQDPPVVRPAAFEEMLRRD